MIRKCNEDFQQQLSNNNISIDNKLSQIEKENEDKIQKTSDELLITIQDRYLQLVNLIDSNKNKTESSKPSFDYINKYIEKELELQIQLILKKKIIDTLTSNDEVIKCLCNNKQFKDNLNKVNDDLYNENKTGLMKYLNDYFGEYINNKLLYTNDSIAEIRNTSDKIVEKHNSDINNIKTNIEGIKQQMLNHIQTKLLEKSLGEKGKFMYIQ